MQHFFAGAKRVERIGDKKVTTKQSEPSVSSQARRDNALVFLKAWEAHVNALANGITLQPSDTGEIQVEA